jgi:hypothetical protein
MSSVSISGALPVIILGVDYTSYQSALQTTPFKVVFGRDLPSLVSYQPGIARVIALDKQLQHRDEFLSEIRKRLL